MRRHADIAKRARRSPVKAGVLGGLGLLLALVLIAGSLAGLDRQVFEHSDWQRFQTAGPDRAVVLAPDPFGPAPLGGMEAEQAVLGATATSPAVVSGGTDVSAAADGDLADGAPAVGAGTPARGDSADGETRRLGADDDSDGDGLSDLVEFRLGTNAMRADTDGDAMPDGWEARNALDPKDPVDAAADSDGDGLTNRVEYLVRSDPRSLDTDRNGTPDGDDDSDGDSLSNVVEARIPSLDPTSADSDADGVADGDADADGDGTSNRVEVEAGRDPVTPDTPVEPTEPTEEPQPEVAPEPTVAPEPAPAGPPAEEATTIGAPEHDPGVGEPAGETPPG